MAGDNITIAQAPEWVTRLEPAMKKAALRGLLGAAMRVVSNIQEIIAGEERVPVDRGIYRAGWKARAIEDGAQVTNSAPHAGFIEDGVRAANVKPGRAMIDALAGWVVRKGLTESSRGVERAAEARRIAWAIARSMQKKGIFAGGKGLKIHERATRNITALIEQEVRREIARELKI